MFILKISQNVSAFNYDKYLNILSKIILKVLISIISIPILLSCSSEVKINIEDFNNSYQKAIESKFELRNDKVFLLNEKNTFSGKINLSKNDSIFKQITVKDGEIETLKTYINGDLIFEAIKTNKKLASKGFPLKNSTIKSTFNCDCINVTNYLLLSSDELEGSCILKIASENITLNSISKKKGEDFITESVATDINQKVIYKEITKSRKISDSLSAKIIFKENFQESVLNKYQLLYQEILTLTKNNESLELETNYDSDKNVNIHSRLDNYDNKHCKDGETLFMSSPIYGIDGEVRSTEQTSCVDNVLQIINRKLNKNITRKNLLDRIKLKEKNNQFTDFGSYNISFYF